MYTRGAVPETRAALANALAIAERLGDTDYQLRALWGLCVDRLNNGVFREALALAERFCSVAADSAEQTDGPIGDRMMGLSLALPRRPDQRTAPFRTHAQPLPRAAAPLAHDAFSVRPARDGPHRARGGAVDTGLSRRSHARRREQHRGGACAPARALAVQRAGQGLPGRPSCRRPRRPRSASSRCCWITRRAIRSPPGRRKAAASRPCCGIKRGDVAGGVQALRDALGELPGINFSLRYTALLGELAEALGHAGDVEQATLTIAEALARSERNEERWCIAELLRIEGELILLADGSGAAVAAEGRFRDGLDWARRQGALSWELRCAASLARAVARAGLTPSGAGAAELGVRPLYRGLRQRRSGRGEKTSGDARVGRQAPSLCPQPSRVGARNVSLCPCGRGSQSCPSPLVGVVGEG